MPKFTIQLDRVETTHCWVDVVAPDHAAAQRAALAQALPLERNGAFRNGRGVAYGVNRCLQDDCASPETRGPDSAP